MAGRSSVTIEPKYRFTGKEKSEATGHYLFGARTYNSLIGKWDQVEPLSDLYPSKGSYVYCNNNPLIIIDPTGMCNECGVNCDHPWEVVVTANKPDNSSSADNVENQIQVDLICNEINKPNASTPWINVEMGELGTAEIEGIENNPRIIEYHSTAGGAKDDETAWCSSFMNWIMKQMYIKGTGSPRALSWLDWGKQLKGPAYGAIVIFRWPNTGGHGHVGTVVGFTKSGSIVVLGGNQHEMVRYSAFSTKDIAGYVYPQGYKPNYQLPILKISPDGLSISPR